jgi:F420 biosynthesis protein FbiB-like protein
METFEAIAKRRSIRRFQPDAVPQETIEQILGAAILAPSAMNVQPWRFVVLQGAQKEALMARFLQRIQKLKKLTRQAAHTETTARFMQQAPALILVFNTKSPGNSLARIATLLDTMYIQSIGAAIQNLLLAAASLGLGTLWTGHALVAGGLFAKFAGVRGRLVAAIALGYPDESPNPRPRKSMEEVVQWMQ